MQHSTTWMTSLKAIIRITPDPPVVVVAVVVVLISSSSGTELYSWTLPLRKLDKIWLVGFVWQSGLLIKFTVCPIQCLNEKSNPFYFFKKWAIPGLFFFYFRLFNTQLTVYKCSILIKKILPMTVFEPRTSDIGSHRSTNWATTTSLEWCVLFGDAFFTIKKCTST